MLVLCSAAVSAAPEKTKKTLPISKAEKTVKENDKKKALGKFDKKAEPDCDEKAKKPVEIIPESISLSGGTAGCTLDE